jgi:hypothetical protein
VGPLLLESAAMKRLRPSLILAAGSALLVALAAGPAAAQESIDPSTTPVKNIGPTGPITPFGIHVSIAALLFILGIIVVVITVILYMRYAPRFAQDEESMKVVRADRVRPGQELPRRNVDLSQASPVVVAPPALPAAVGAAPALVAVAAPAAAAPAAAPPAEATSVPPAVAAPAAAPALAPDVAAPAPAVAAPAERVEVTMDQAVYDSTFAELLAAGTDRRIAEGKARRAGMIAAKKAAGAG